MTTSPLRVLLVEDNPADARLVLRELRQAGFEPDATRADTEPEFLASLDPALDVVLCDYNLPQFDALRALALARERLPEVPFLIVSGSIGEETAVEAMKQGATDYLLKDRLTRLGPAVRQALAKRALREEERRAREALRASEAQYRALADSIPHLVWTARSDGTLDYLNRQTAEYCGLGAAGALGWAWERVVHPDDMPRTAAVWEDTLRTGEACEFEFRLRRADGVYRWHINRQVAVRDAAGAVARWFGTCTDIHDQKAAAEQLARDALILGSVRDSVIVTDLSGAVTYWNEGATRLFGWAAAETIGRPYADRFPEPTRTWIAAEIRDRAGGSEWNAEYEDYRKDGSRVWIDARVTPIADAAGRPAGVMGVAHDITDRKRAEVERDDLLARLTLQIERMPLAYVLTGPDLRYTRWNPAAERIFGFTQADVLGKHPFEVIVPAQSRPLVTSIFDRLATGDMNAHGVCENVTRDGRTITCEWFNTPLLDAAGEFVGLLSLAQDITARKKLEEQLRQAQKMEAFGQLAGGVAHDFNNLLTVINGYSDLLLTTLPPDAAGRDAVGAIRDAGERAAALTAQLLAFSRKTIIEPKVFDLNAVVESIGKLLRRLIGEDVRLTIALAPALSRVKADRGPDRAGDHQPGGERPGRDADRRAADRRDGGCRPRAGRPAPRPGLPAGPVRPAGRVGHGNGHDRRGEGEDLRAVLHDQGGRQGDRAGTGDRVRDRDPGRRARQRGQ